MLDLPALSAQFTALAEKTQQNFVFLEQLVALLFGLWVLNVLLGGRLCLLGIHPRRLLGLPGIFFAPFLHASFNHLFFNLIPLLVLSDFILIRGQDYFLFVSTVITLLSGSLIWLFGKSGIHVGASAVITGYWALLVMQMFTEAGLLPVVLGLVSLYYFATLFFGIFPSERGVSWEGHLFGLLSGLALGYWLA